jgi:hypothetical protein
MNRCRRARDAGRTLSAGVAAARFDVALDGDRRAAAARARHVFEIGVLHKS